MLNKIKSIYGEFMEGYEEYKYYCPDGGFNYLDRYNDFKKHFLKDGIELSETVFGEDVFEFSSKEDAKEFYNMIKWLSGVDSHFTSCKVSITNEDNKVICYGYNW